MFNNKMKAVTFSYDDGITQDRQLIDMFNKYGLKATFNLNSELLGTNMSLIRNDFTIAHCKPRAIEVPRIYAGHEVAVHTLTHPTLSALDDETEILRQVNEDRKNLSEITGYNVVGMAYPGGKLKDKENYTHEVAELIRNKTEIKYARTTVCTGNFDLQDNLFEFKPTVYHLNWEEMFSLAERFIELKPETPKLFYIWGHSYEFDFDNTWSKMEEFCKLISGHDDIFYGTNKEVLL